MAYSDLTAEHKLRAIEAEIAHLDRLIADQDKIISTLVSGFTQVMEKLGADPETMLRLRDALFDRSQARAQRKPPFS